MEDIDRAWFVVTSAILDPLSGIKTKYNTAALRHSLDVLCDNKMDAILNDWFFETVRKQVCSTVAPNFWQCFQVAIPTADVVVKITTAFVRLHAQLSTYAQCADRLVDIYVMISDIRHSASVHNSATELRTDLMSRLQLIYRGVIFYRTTCAFDDAMNSFFAQSIRAFDAVRAAKTAADESGDGEDGFFPLTCAGCMLESESCRCRETFAAFGQLVGQLTQLGVLERVTAEPVAQLIHRRIEQHVDETCRGCFDTRYLDKLREWLGTGIVAWMDELFKAAVIDSQPAVTTTLMSTSTPMSSASSSPLSPHLSTAPSYDSPHFARLYAYMCEAYGRTRIAQLFNIIVEFPESQPALSDLAECMEKANLRPILVQSLRAALESRLLHPGVNTSDILTAYISAIPALRQLDRTGVLLDLVCEPVRRYLRGREDTVRCIVSSLTEDGNGELSDELTRGGQLTLDDSFAGDDCSPPDANWQSWSPDPVDAPNSSKSGHGRRGSDVISTLVNIYGSKELFINEYRNILANRILTQFNYDADKEVRYLELLKLRFGETHLHNCEVMLKDVADSRRINTRIADSARCKLQSTVPSNDKPDEIPVVNAMILSAQFWPPKLREEKVELPSCLQAALDSYTHAYELLKGNRTLVWKPHLGLVSIDVEIKDKVLSYCVSPVHATIIWHYQTKPRWTVDELSEVMQIPSQALQRKLAFWQSQGLLHEESTDTFVLVEDHRSISSGGNGAGGGEGAMGLDEEEAESALASAQDQKEEELQVVWSYVVGMLRNLESLPIDRIHSMLKMFTMQGAGSQCTIIELKALLDRRIKEQKLTYSNGVYRLVKH